MNGTGSCDQCSNTWILYSRALGCTAFEALVALVFMGVSSHNCEKQDCVHTATGGLLNLVPSYGVALYWVSISNSTEVSSRWICPGVGSSNERWHESQRIVIPNLTLINPRFCVHFCNCKVGKLVPPELQRVLRRYWCRAHEQQSAAPPGGGNESHPTPPARVAKWTIHLNPKATSSPSSVK